MKSPLNKRVFREIKGDAGKYIVIFIFMVALIGAISGFLIAGTSLKRSYDESFSKYNIEDGNFELSKEADDKTKAEIEKEKVKLYENFYIEVKTKNVDSTIRLFKDRKDVDKICLLDGKLAKNDDEISIDRVYAKNNDLKIGNTLKVDDRTLKIVGLVALSDYSALYQNNNEFMFDSIKFGVGVVSDNCFEDLGKGIIHYSYSWKYDDPPKERESKEAVDKADDLMKVINSKAELKDFIPGCSSNAINFSGDDIGGDRIMIIVMMYILIVVIAFVFGIITSNTISKDANVIGTLRASGYTKGELVRHYMTAPMLVLLIAAIIGNILGYTFFKNVWAEQYLGSYSLTSYKTIWNADAFVQTTVFPIILMAFINFVMLARKLSLSPMKFLRRDLKRHHRKKAFKLNTKLPFMTRFRLRVIFQNIPNFVVIFVGIVLGEFVMYFGNMMGPVVNNIEQEALDNMLAQHQYILKAPCETETKNAEKFCLEGLKSSVNGSVEDDISIYGLDDNSKYFKNDLKDGKVYVTKGYADKYSLKTGDDIKLKEEYGDKEYKFKIDGIYGDPVNLSVFMDKEKFNKTFDKEDDYYSGYLSDKEIKDIGKEYIATEVTADDYTKMSRQLKNTMGSMIYCFTVLGVVMLVLIVYLLSKIVIEKNAQSISMAKILGYSKREINGVYIHTTSIVTIISLIIGLPIVGKLVGVLWHVMMVNYSGWIPYEISGDVYIKTFITGLLSYVLCALLLTRQTQKVNLEEALKNVE